MCVSAGQACSGGSPSCCRRRWSVLGGGGASASVRASGPSGISTTSFTNTFTVMKQFKSLAAAGKGKVAAILPDTVSSTRYVEFDQPDITKALQTAGLSSSSTSCRTRSAAMPLS